MLIESTVEDGVYEVRLVRVYVLDEGSDVQTSEVERPMIPEVTQGLDRVSPDGIVMIIFGVKLVFEYKL